MKNNGKNFKLTTLGFTLIELLAVIVILAIIALIAVPVILNIIDKANKSAFKDTAYGIIQAGELYFAEQLLEPNGMQGDVTIQLPDERIPLKGNVPKGWVTITTDGKISIAVKNDRYCITKGLDDTDVTVTENAETCELTGGNGGMSLPALGTSAEDCTWNEIKAISEAGKGDEYFNLGDTKTFTTTDGKTIVMKIVAFNADTKADGSGTAGITWMSQGSIASRVMNSTLTNVGGWEASELREWIQGEFYSTLPEEVKGAIITVDKTYYDYTTKSTLSCEDNVWIPSGGELFGNGKDWNESFGVEYTNYFTSNSIRDSIGGGTNYWYRTAAQYGSGNFRNSLLNGDFSGANAHSLNDVALCFCT